MIFRTAADAGAAQQAVRGSDIDGFFCLSFTDCEDGFDAHGAGFITGSALRTGDCVLFQAEKAESVEQADHISQRADVTETASFEKSTDKDEGHHESAEVDACFKTGKGGGEGNGRAEVTEIRAGKSDAEEDQQHDPFDEAKSCVQPVCERDSFCMQCLP